MLKKWYVVSFVFIVTATVCFGYQNKVKANDSEVIKFEDTAFEKVIREKLQKPEGNIRQQELDGISELYIWGKTTNNVVEYNLREYKDDMGNTFLEAGDIRAVNDLKYFKNLKSLTLANQQIKDFKALENLTGMDSLVLSANNISDFQFLTKMPNLKKLIIDYNYLNDLSALSGLEQLEYLDLSYNNISEISGLAKNMNLNVLKIDQGWTNDKVRIKDISVLKNLKYLTIISLEANRIEDLSPLSELTGLKELNLCQNQLKDISVLQGAVNMEKLDLSWNRLSDINPIGNMKKLTVLRLEPCYISNLVILRSLPELKDVDIDWNKVGYSLNISDKYIIEGIYPGNIVNGGKVSFDGKSVYYEYVSYGDLAHPSLIKLDIASGNETDISGEITAHMSKATGKKAGGSINEYITYLNIYKGKLYYYGYGHNNDEAYPESDGSYYPGSAVQGLTRMNLDGSKRETLTTEDCSYISVANDRIVYLNKENFPSTMSLDGKNKKIILKKPCSMLYAKGDFVYYAYKNAGSGLFEMKFDGSGQKRIINGYCDSPIIFDTKLYFLNKSGNICVYDIKSKSSQILIKCNAKSYNISDQYIFYSYDGNVYRTKLNGQNKAPVYKKGNAEASINLVGDYLYIDTIDGLCRVKNNGGEYTECFEYF